MIWRYCTLESRDCNDNRCASECHLSNAIQCPVSTSLCIRPECRIDRCIATKLIVKTQNGDGR